ncbi:HD domain-containing protein [Mesorhizobium sp. Mes31]|uniref:HD domain-containing protein n=1 Tax=Mesorhizobium sp. Mes31 TaxID=2926017 RepID=UPI0021185B1A|nr:HD domain-containing protein [Mesorhizobium sp. Mes31]
MRNTHFAPYEILANSLVPLAVQREGDGSHDISHLIRVWKNAKLIACEEGGDLEIIVAATLLHDCVSAEKNSPERSQSSQRAAEKASGILLDLRWNQSRIEAVAHAIEAHSYSAGIVPKSLEAKILQDADRLDAIGMVGVARCFYTAGRLGQKLYDVADVQARGRSYDESKYTIDHFQTKLLTLAVGFQTQAGKNIARFRHDRLKRFLEEFIEEL